MSLAWMPLLPSCNSKLLEQLQQSDVCDIIQMVEVNHLYDDCLALEQAEHAILDWFCLEHLVCGTRLHSNNGKTCSFSWPCGGARW